MIAQRSDEPADSPDDLFNRPSAAASATPRLLARVTLLAIVAAGGNARAQQQGGFTLNQFRPAPVGDRFFGVQGSDVGGHLVLRAMLQADYANRPLVLNHPSDILNQFVLHVAGSLALWDRLLVSADMPLTLQLTSRGPFAGTPGMAPPSGFALGDLRMGVRLRLAGETRSLASLSFSAQLYAPTGKQEEYASNGEFHGAPALVVSGLGARFAYAATGGVDLRQQSDVADPSTTLGSALTFGAAFALLLPGRLMQIGPEVYGSTVMVGKDRFSRATTNLEALLGARLRFGCVVLSAGAGAGVVRGLGTPSVRGVLSLASAPASCKPVPAPQRPPEPPAPPTLVAKVPSPAPDRDGDGVRDDVDACPNEAGKPDSDAGKTGCPPAVRVTPQEIVILEQVQFQTDSAVILSASDELLFQVAHVLSEHPEIKKIEVQGHTDNQGDRAYNLKLSEKRAEAVRRWLVDRGKVEATRLTSHGYGMEAPISDNETPEGRQKNRRVQFVIVRDLGG